MSRITISDISVEQITEISEADTAAVVGGTGEFNALLAGFAGFGKEIASQKIWSIVDIFKYAVDGIGKV
ncbi:MAG: hypothetical protein HXY43_02690 [Fischerella sp.]|jgi:hypothetical protein|uniref:hypothetical protein n=1 Tax=Fischerella sp. TaxID=1191 RepID=UPI0017DCF109|nr:hypothetical protein [Fischerella sp.]NWF58241.1 hypothetical protein [Fischerella sp.]